MGRYRDLLLASSPALYWPCDETSGTVIGDISGNGHHGKTYREQLVSGAGVTLAVPGATVEGDKAIRINGSWDNQETPAVQANLGTGIRADTYKPYQPGAQLTLSCWCQRNDRASYATLFSGSGGAGGAAQQPSPTLEWGVDKTVTPRQMLARWYADVNTFPAKFMDWGTSITSHPRFEFHFDRWHRINFTFDDTTSLAELWVDGRSQGVQGPDGSYSPSDPVHFSTVADSGLFQVGWRGGPPYFATGSTSNWEVWGGPIQHITIHERILGEREIVDQYRAGLVHLPSLGLADPSAPLESIELAFTGYLRP